MDTLGSQALPLDPSLEEGAEHVLPTVPAVDGEPESLGTVIAFVGSKGGCGVTLLTVNIGVELASDKRVCLIDLAGSNGDIAAYLNLECGHQLAELLGAEHIDGALLDAIATKHRPSRIAVLPQPANLADVALLDPHGVVRVLDAARRAFDLVLVDCSAHLDEAVLTATMRADIVALVFTPDVPAVRNAHRRLLLFDQLHMDRSHLRLVLNRVGRHQQLSVEQIEHHLNRTVSAFVRSDPHACADSQMTGLLLRDLAGRHRINKDISRLGPALLGEVEEPEPARGKLALWLRSTLTPERV